MQHQTGKSKHQRVRAFDISANNKACPANNEPDDPELVLYILFLFLQKLPFVFVFFIFS